MSKKTSQIFKSYLLATICILISFLFFYLGSGNICFTLGIIFLFFAIGIEEIEREENGGYKVFKNLLLGSSSILISLFFVLIEDDWVLGGIFLLFTAFFFYNDKEEKSEAQRVLDEIRNPQQSTSIFSEKQSSVQPSSKKEQTPLFSDKEDKFSSPKKMNSRASNKSDIFEQAFGSKK